MNKQLQILLVDDDEVDRMAIRRALGKMQAEVIIDEAVDISSGLSALSKVSYDCAIIDYLLPDGTGLNLVKEARYQLESPVPIIMLTGKGDRDIDLAVMEAGASDYLEKDGLRSDILDRAIRYAIRNKQLVIEIQKANEKLREIDKLKSEFLSTASHELRTPLTIIREFVSLVHDQVTGPINEDQKDCLYSALTNCDRLAEIVNDLLDLQRIESGKIQLKREKHNINNIIKQCCCDFEPRFRLKKQNLGYSLDEYAPSVYCDNVKILQVLINLIGNAHKFTPEGGFVKVKAFTEGDEMIIEIEDSGPGIKDEDKDAVFEQFTQIDRQHGPGPKGTGLGLAICKKILAHHGGRIFAASADNGGARFTFTLPLYKPRVMLLSFILDNLAKADVEDEERCLIILKPNLSSSDALREKLKLIYSVADKTLRRKNDAVEMFDEMGLVAVMADANKTSAKALAGRIARALSFEIGEQTDIRCGVMNVSIENTDQILKDLQKISYMKIFNIVTTDAVEVADLPLLK